ncbi:hypothetical protein F5Y13DRAFT_201176 [Hypoxylon sp. FL1857]|nr:hypothetical protein F5Y13DRAFT_201176 [Hypoxylon sp. FL1857]
MDGHGSMDDARALQAYFRRPDSPRRNNRGRGRGSGNGSQRGSLRGNGRQDHSLPARGTSNNLGPRQRGYMTTMPAPQSTQGREKRIASSERDYDSKRLKGSTAEDVGQANYFSSGQVSSQSFNAGAFARRPPVGNNDLMEFEQPAPPPRPSMRQGNTPAQFVLSGGPPSDSSILDMEGDEIKQPVMDFTTRNSTRGDRREGGKMGDTKKSSFKGLAASRWNTEDVQPQSHYGGDPMSIDTPQSEKRRPTPHSGRLVSSGISKGPGLADSRWAS